MNDKEAARLRALAAGLVAAELLFRWRYRSEDLELDHRWALLFHCRHCGTVHGGTHAPSCPVTLSWLRHLATTRQFWVAEADYWPPRALRHGPTWTDWLARLREAGALHGSELADGLGDSADADALLLWAEEGGAVRRGRQCPALSQFLLNGEPRLAWHIWEAA